ncbi:MAG TPA: hypothetical protein VF221_05670, partial [Chloroflexota bacterium]
MIVVGICSILQISLTAGPAHAAKSRQDLPTSVWGQPNVSSTTCRRPSSSSTLCGPAQSAVDNHGNLWVADFVANRVVMYPRGSTKATMVFGQYGSFTTRGCDQAPPPGSRYPRAPNRYT